MNRRDAIKTVSLGLCAPAISVAEIYKVREVHRDYEELYWEAQAHIDKLEEMLSHYEINRELANHYEAMKMMEKFE